MQVPLNTLRSKGPGNSVHGLDQLSWSNVDLSSNKFYWANLSLMTGTVMLLCTTLHHEFSIYISFCQNTSRDNFDVIGRTMLVADIPKDVLSTEPLIQIYGVFPGGVEAVLLNRDVSGLAAMLQRREKIRDALELAETRLIRKRIKSHVLGGEDSVLTIPSSASAHNSGVNPSHSALSSFCGRSGADEGINRVPRDEHRPAHRLPILSWLPILPLLGTKVDSISHSLRSLASLSTEITSTLDAEHNREVLNSAFIQFYTQVGAHVAYQTLIHCNTSSMNVQCIGIAPDDILWPHLRLSWTNRGLRTAVVMTLMSALVVGWALPVAFTGFLSQMAYAPTFWPNFARLSVPLRGLITGVLPPLMLALLFVIVPFLTRLVSERQGFLTVRDLELAIQRYYFSFLFVQVFLTVAVSASATTIINNLAHGVESIPLVLASNLPKTSNYFFSYLLVQGLSISANQLAQILKLLGSLYRSMNRDASPRRQWQRRKAAFDLQWGTLIPVFTNLACIGQSCILQHTQRKILGREAYHTFQASFTPSSHR